MITSPFLNLISYTLFFLPAALICILPVRNHLRLPKKFVYSGIVIINFISGFFVIYISELFQISVNSVLVVGLLPILFCYIFVCRVYPPILVFIFATAMLSMAFASGCTDGICLEFFIDSQNGQIIYLGVQLGFLILFLIPIVFLLIRRITKVVNEYKNRKVWRVLWIIPLTLTSILMLFPLNTVLNYFYASIFLSIGCIIIYYIIFMMMEQSVLASNLQEENNAKEKLLIIEQAQYNTLFSGIEQTRIARHDLRHHFNAIMVYNKNNQPDKLQSYIEQYLSSHDEEKLTVFCDNPIINMLLSYYQSLAKKHGIKTNFVITVPDTVAIAEPDLWVLFGNCLENAIEACCRYDNSDKHINLTVKQKGEMLGITIDNSYQGEINKDKNNAFISSKTQSRAGVGLHSVQTVVDKYQGMLQVNYDGKLFSVSVMLCLTE